MDDEQEDRIAYTNEKIKKQSPPPELKNSCGEFQVGRSDRESCCPMTVSRNLPVVPRHHRVALLYSSTRHCRHPRIWV